MKKLNSRVIQKITRFTLALDILILCSASANSQCTHYSFYDDYDCAPINDAYLENNCFAPVDRYLARTITMSDLVGVNHKVWPDNNPCNTEGLPNPTKGQGCYYLNSDQYSYGYCPDGYCPEMYWCDIDLCTELKAAFIKDVAALWGSEDEMIPDNTYYKAATIAVKDINNAYDCAGLMRPIIGASVYEYISPEQIGDVPITEDVILAFEDEMTAADEVYYLDEYLQPKINLHYNYSRIAADYILYAHSVADFTNIEARMWFYYCSTKYIDDGYKDLHLGITEVETYNDEPDNINTYNLFSKIRQYAIDKGTFVIIDGATTNEETYNGSDLSILDFNENPIRPSETDYSCLNGELVSNSGGSAINHYPSCNTPFGCYESPSAPYSIVFDNNGGITGVPYTSDPDPGKMWGFDEARWFYEVNKIDNIGDACASNLLQSLMCGIRTLETTTRGYIQVPGKRTIGPWDSFNYIAWYRLYDHPDIKNAIYNVSENTGVWKPNDNTSINMQTVCGEINNDDCDAHHFQEETSFIFSVPNPDCSTVYTWHIQNPDGAWQPFTYGTSRTFDLPTEGDYTISLRQDNLGYDPSTYGTIEHSFVKNLKYCCGPYHETEKVGDSNQNDDNNSEKIALPSVLEIYPNPTTGNFTLELQLGEHSAEQIAQLEIRNLLGKIIYNKSLMVQNGTLKEEINLTSQLQAGIYIANVIGVKNTLQKKFLCVK